MMVLRAEGTAQWVKHLLYKHEDMSSDPRNPHKTGQVAYIWNPVLLWQDGGGDRRQSRNSQAKLAGQLA